MNVENIKRVRDHIAGLAPERFDMSEWVGAIRGTEDGLTPADLLHNCGTCGCIGGWTDAIFNLEGNDWIDTGAVLGLEYDDADALFYPANSDIGGRPWSAITQAEALKVLDHLLATGEVNWAVVAPEAA